MNRLGYYVEGKYFAGKANQAIAFAQNRANQFGRSVDVHCVDHTGEAKIVDTKFATETPPSLRAA